MLSDSQVQEIAHAAAKKATRDVFAILGVDVDKPESVSSFLDDLRFGRRMRQAADKSWLTFFALGATAMGYLMWQGLIDFIHRGSAG